MDDHNQDSDCTIGSDGCCIECGVSHTGDCDDCGGKAFHTPGCLLVLCDELDEFCRHHGLPKKSADDYGDDETTPEQRVYLSEFVDRWDAAVEAA